MRAVSVLAFGGGVVTRRGFGVEVVVGLLDAIAVGGFSTGLAGVLEFELVLPDDGVGLVTGGFGVAAEAVALLRVGFSRRAVTSSPS